MQDKLLFQYCQKIVVFSQDFKSVLLAKRKGEADYDGVYSFIGGKMETTDSGFVNGLTREKNEEAGEGFQILINPQITFNEMFVKKDGNSMVLPHYFAIYDSGAVVINDEYSDYAWVAVSELATFQPLIPTIPPIVDKMLANLSLLNNPENLIKI